MKPDEIRFVPEPIVEQPADEEPATAPWKRGKKDKPVEESPVKPDEVRFVPEPIVEKPADEEPATAPWKRGKKEKPVVEATVKPDEVRFVPDVEETIPEEEIIQEEDIEDVVVIEEEEEQVETKEKRKRKKKHRKPKHEEFEVEDFPRDISPDEEELVIKPKKHVAFRENLESTIDIMSDSNDELLEVFDDNVSTEQLTFKPVKKGKKGELQEAEIFEEQSEFRKETQVKTSSQVVKRQRKQIVIDDSRPIPDLEIISQKRVIEGINKIADESLIEESRFNESKKQITSKTLIEKSQLKTTTVNIKPPKFIQKLQPVISEPDVPVVLKGEVDGSPFPDIKWFFNETEVENSERYEMIEELSNVTLTIKSVSDSDVGIYTCQATNPGGVATSRTNLIVQEPEEFGEAPSFITPLKITVPEDKDKAIVTCQVYGTPKPEVKWYKEEIEIIPNENVQTIYDEDTGYVTLEVLNPETNVPVVYEIQAENKYGKAIGRANVFIQSIIIEKKAEAVRAPKILTPLQAQVVKSQSTLRFDCKYDGTPKPKIKWYKNGKEIVIDENISVETHEYRSTIEVRNITRKNAGKYEIIVTNKGGEAKSSGSVVVSDAKDTEEVKAPRFIETLVPKLVAEAEVVILEATVESYPTSSFQWFYNSTPIKTSQETRIATTENKSILIIESFISENVGAYTCRAENVAGSVTSTATIHILEPTETEEVAEFISPRFVEKADSAKIMDGEKLILTARVQGVPTPKVEWQHNRATIMESKDIFTQQDNSGLCNLIINEVFPEDAGEYTCVATNKIGEAICRCVVTVDGNSFFFNY